MNTTQPGDDEAALVAAWRRGDSQAARLAVDLHGAAMLRLALALSHHADDAEDVVQDAFLDAFRALDRFDARQGSLRAWLLGVTANRARRARRGRLRRMRFLERLRREPYVPAALDDRGDLAFARRRLAALPRREREAFVLVEIEGLTSVEAASLLRIADSTVRVLVSRARNRLQSEEASAPARPLRLEGRER
jgi:RNA polymerase sigma-70 factor (ECF subfamily)